MDIFKKLNEILINEKIPSKEFEKLMVNNDFIESYFNIFNKLKDIPQDKKFHPEGNVWNHTKLVIDTAAKVKGFSRNSNRFMWAALFHDIGKIQTTKFIKGRYRSYNHDTVGEEVTYNILINYMNKDEAKEVAEIVRFHMHHIYILKDLPFSNISALTSSKNYHDIVLLFICDKLGRGNQNISEKKKALEEINKILDKLRKENSEINKEITKELGEIKEIIIK
ncbi:MAG: HDIG domain-containing protein [Clostridium sartagoforme]|nr:HDIG domain-containing protein [Clostridium sartagoforme]